MCKVHNNSDVSVVVCAKNAAANLDLVISSIKMNEPFEIILVDANSDDGTKDIAEKHEVKLINDPGNGLALARNIGLKEVRGKYILFVGPDNVLEADTIERLKDYLLKYNYVGVGGLTRLKERNKNYLTKGADKRWQVRFYEGNREVIGTPYIYFTDILKKYAYDDKMTWSDDADLCTRLAKDGLKVGYSNVICYEIGVESLKSIRSRFRLYGLSDYEYYKKYSLGWSIKRKIKSMLHPINSEFIFPILKSENIIELLYFVPFFMLITLFRYSGWIKAALKKKF